jgi:YggT family protein
VIPARRVLPSVRRVDLPTLVVLLALESIATLLLYLIGPFPLRLDLFVGSVVLRLVSLTIWVYWGAILIYVLLGWVVQGYHPIADALGTLIGSARAQIIPPSRVGFSPMIDDSAVRVDLPSAVVRS